MNISIKMQGKRYLIIYVCAGPSGVWGLKKNFALLELLERLLFNPDESQLSSNILSKQKEVNFFSILFRLIISDLICSHDWSHFERWIEE